MGINPVHTGRTLCLILFLNFIFESKYVQQLISKGSPRAYKFRGTSGFLDNLCAISDVDFLPRTYFYKSFLTKGTSFLSLLCVCLICGAIFHHQYSMVEYFQSSYR